MPHMPPSGLIRYFQTNTMIPPTNMPAKAPFRLVRFQKRENSMIGPKDAPKPAHAKDTIAKTELSGSLAINTPITAMQITVIRATNIEAFSESSICNTSCNKLCETLEDAAKSWESDVDIVHAKIPARMIPAKIIAITPWLLSSMAILMIKVSDWEESVKAGICPALEIL